MSEASTPEVPAGRGERVVLRISTIILAATLLAFLLPLVAVSCGTPAGYGSAGGGVTATYSGLTLVTGGEPSLNPPNKPLPEGASRDEDRVSSQPGVDGALAVIVVALLVSLSIKRRRTLLVAVLAAAAALLTIYALAEFQRQWTGRIVAKLVAINSPGLARADQSKLVTAGLGFWIVMLLLSLTVVLDGVTGVAALITQRRQGVRTRGTGAVADG